MYVYSNSHNDIPRVAQQYATIATHTRLCLSVLVVFVVFCVHMHSFAGLIRRTPLLRFSDTESPTATLIPLFSSSELTGFGYPGLLDQKIIWTCAPGGSQTLDSLRARRAPYPLSVSLPTYLFWFGLNNIYFEKLSHTNVQTEQSGFGQKLQACKDHLPIPIL